MSIWWLILAIAVVLVALLVQAMREERRVQRATDPLMPQPFAAEAATEATPAPKRITWKTLWRLWPLLLVATCGYLCSIRRYDVTDRFRTAVASSWCTSEDGFVVRYSDTGELYWQPIGGTSDVPHTLEDYARHPHDWWKLPAYAGTFTSEYVKPQEIRAAIPKGTAFKFVRIVEQHHPEVGVTLQPEIRLSGDLAALGDVHASFLLEDPFEEKTLSMRWAAKCR